MFLSLFFFPIYYCNTLIQPSPCTAPPYQPYFFGIASTEILWFKVDSWTGKHVTQMIKLSKDTQIQDLLKVHCLMKCSSSSTFPKFRSHSELHLLSWLDPQATARCHPAALGWITFRGLQVSGDLPRCLAFCRKKDFSLKINSRKKRTNQSTKDGHLVFVNGLS